MDMNKFKKRDLLQIYNLITTKGSKLNGSYEFLGIRASQDKETLKVFLNKISRLLAEKDSL